MPPLRTPIADHPELHPGAKIQTSCPNFVSSPYDKDVGRPRALKPQISVKVLIGRLAKLDQRPGSPIRRNASTIAYKCGLDPRELLHMAIDRALRSGTSRPNVPLEPYLTMLMRSIGSGIAEARRRADERASSSQVKRVHEQLPQAGSILDPVRTIERQREQEYFQCLIDELAGDDQKLIGLIDGIGMGERGLKLARTIKINQRELATLLRKLKRRATNVAHREGLFVHTAMS